MAKRYSNANYVENVDENVVRAVQLTKELVSKLQKIIDPIVDHLDRVDFDERSYKAFPANYHRLRLLVDQAKYMLPVASDIAQTISQRIEHTSLDPFSTFEMRLVLAELETAIHNAERLMQESDLVKLLNKR